jgi:hypothetical protein
MCNLGDLGDIMASLVQEHPTTVEELQRFELYTKELKTENTSLEERVGDLKRQYTNAMNTYIKKCYTLEDQLELKDTTLKSQLALKDIALEKKLASKDVVIEYLTTTSVSDYILIFIWIVVGMVLGVFHEPATNVIAYIGNCAGECIHITALYIVRQVILALLALV